jgi:hypothetical protein
MFPKGANHPNGAAGLAGGGGAGAAGASGLCLETQSRQIMAVLVHDVVAEAMRLGLHDQPAKRIVTVNGAPLRRRTAG